MSANRTGTALSEPTTQAAPRWLGWALVLVVITVFAPTLGNPFAPIDDQPMIWENPRLNPPRFDSESILWFWAHPQMGTYMPLPYLVWGVLAKASWVPTPDENGVHLDPRFFHAGSIMLHALCVLAVWRLLCRLLPARPWSAAAGALLFGVHPLQVEAVAWATNLKDVLSALFSVVALTLYVADVQEAKGWRRPALGIACVLLGMLCKPTAIITPVMAVAVDRLLLRRHWSQIVRTAWPWFVAGIPLALLAKSVQPPDNLARHLGLVERCVVAGASTTFYLQKLFWPARLTFDYGWRPEWMLEHRWFWCFALPAPIIAAGIYTGRRRWPWPAAGASVSIIALLPVLGFFPFWFQFYSTVADRYVYLAMVGAGMVLAWLTSRGGRWSVVITSAVLAALAVRTVIEERYWRTDEMLLARQMEIQPHSILAHNAMGVHYLNGPNRNLARAEQEFRTTEQIEPLYEMPHKALSNIYFEEGRPAEAIEQVRMLIEGAKRLPPSLQQDHPSALLYMAKQALLIKRFKDAAAYAQAFLEYRPDSPEGMEALKAARAAIATQPAIK